MERPEWMGGASKRPAEDVVIGPKRMPALNPRSAPPAPAQRSSSPSYSQPSSNAPSGYDSHLPPAQGAPQMAPPPPPKPRPDIDTNPYDYYEDHGNSLSPWGAVSSPPAQPQMAANPPPVPAAAYPNGDELSASSRAAMVEAPPAPVMKQVPAPMQQAAPIQQAMPAPTPAPRIEPMMQAAPMPSEPLQPMIETPPAAPVMAQEMNMQPAPVEQRTVSSVPAFLRDAPEAASAASPAAPAPVEYAVSEEAPAVVMEEGKPETGWFGRLADRISGKPEPRAIEASINKPYPSLSEVPEKPEAFTAAQTEKDMRLQELRADHAMAQEQREALEAEPSQLDTIQLDNMASSAAPVANTEAPAPVVMGATPEPLPLEAAPPAPAAGGQVLLGHASDSEKPQLSMPTQETQAYEIAEPTAEQRAAQPRDNSWWNRMNPFSERQANPAPSGSALIPSAQAEEIPAQPIEEETPVVMEEEGEALPSPSVLGTVKPMPPSPYSSHYVPAAAQ